MRPMQLGVASHGLAPDDFVVENRRWIILARLRRGRAS